MTDIKTELNSMLFDNLPMMKQFNKDRYADAYKEYCEKYNEVFAKLEEEYAAADDKDGLIKGYATAFKDHAAAERDRIEKKSDREHFIIDHNPVLTVYMLPALAGNGTEACSALAKEIADQWNATFTRYRISIGTFEEIDGGFKRKLCYITTAVCESLGKPDDCYELRTLRSYRDDYLMNCEDGSGIVKTYYDIAPTIVSRINKRDDRKQVYRDIFKDYIKPCISMIEEGKHSDCKKLYSEMVYSLRDEYIYDQNGDRR